MGFLDAFGHGLLIFGQDCLKQLFRLLEGAGHDVPICGGDGIVVFPGDFLVGNEDFLRRVVIAQIPQMDQQGQHVICRMEAGHVIAEGLCIDHLAFSCQKFYDGIPQPVKVHGDIDFEGFIGLCLVPVGVESAR